MSFACLLKSGRPLGFGFVALALIALALPAAAQVRRSALNDVKTWAYQLKDINQEKLDKIAASPFDMVIIDSSMFPNGKEIRLTREQIQKLKTKPDGSRRLVVTHTVRNGITLDKGECERTLQHLARLWGYRARLIEVDSETGRVLKEHEVLPMP